MRNLRGWMYGGIAIATVGLLAGCVADGGGKKAKKPGSPTVEARRKLMRGQVGSLKKLKKAIKAKNPDAVAKAAKGLAASAGKISAAFAKKDLRGKTRAKGSIWSQKTEFDQLAANLKLSAQLLVMAGEGHDKAGIMNGMKTVGAACGKCHKAYRKKAKPKKFGAGSMGARVKASGAMGEMGSVKKARSKYKKK